MFLLHKTVKPLNINIRWFVHLNKPIRQQSFGSLSTQLVLKSQIQNNLIFKRNFIYRTVFWFLYPSDQKLREKDGVAPHYKMIYKGSSWKYVKYGYSFMLGTFALGAVSVLGSQFLPVTGTNFFITELHEAGIAAAIVAAMMIVTHDLGSNYVYRMYYSEEDDKFRAIVMNKHPFSEKSIELLPKCLVQHKPSTLENIVPWKHFCYKNVEKKPFYIHYANFERMEYYNKLIKEHHDLVD